MTTSWLYPCIQAELHPVSVQPSCYPSILIFSCPSLPPAVRCPAPVTFENGVYTPRLGSHPVGGNLSFECEDGFTLRGSPVRHCRPNGMWDGETAVCDNGGECPDRWLHGGRGLPGALEPDMCLGSFCGDRAWCFWCQNHIPRFWSVEVYNDTSLACGDPGSRKLVLSFRSNTKAPNTLSSFSKCLKTRLVFGRPGLL